MSNLYKEVQIDADTKFKQKLEKGNHLLICLSPEAIDPPPHPLQREYFPRQGSFIWVPLFPSILIFKGERGEGVRREIWSAKSHHFYKFFPVPTKIHQNR